MTRPSRNLSRNSLPVGGSRTTLSCVSSACRGACSSPFRFSIGALVDAFFVVCCMVFSFLLWVGTEAFASMRGLAGVLFHEADRSKEWIRIGKVQGTEGIEALTKGLCLGVC